MLLGTIILEDTTMVFERDQQSNLWSLRTMDAHSGLTHTWDALTDEQMGSIVALAIAGDFTNQDVNSGLYNIAEPLMLGVDNQVRPIP